MFFLFFFIIIVALYNEFPSEFDPACFYLSVQYSIMTTVFLLLCINVNDDPGLWHLFLAH